MIPARIALHCVYPVFSPALYAEASVVVFNNAVDFFGAVGPATQADSSEVFSAGVAQLTRPAALAQSCCWLS